ncbi:MAG: U32 family peptidase [Treponemataceae bacterium]|nr:U32 family peptidase [Treponemataceae bacterium]
MGTIELLAPAGSPEALDAAIHEGADAVYLGLKTFNARLRTTNFAYSQFEAAVQALHRQKKKVYVTVNTVFEERETERIYQFLHYLASVGPDALIIQDFGIVQLVRLYFPSLKLHASTQMNIASSDGANFLSKQGFSRVVLARELNKEEIEHIRNHTALELEIFVHGALCISASGLCLFSSYLGGKSANRGMCTQACRRLYKADDKEGYYFSPADLQLIEKVPHFADIGIQALKIEGRMKSAEYVGTVVAAYRHLLDNLEGNREKALQEAQAMLRNDFARPKTVYYYDRTSPAEWLNPNQAGGTGIPLGSVLQVRRKGEQYQGLIAPPVVVLQIGDSLRFHKGDDSKRQSLKIHTLEPTNTGFWIPIPEGFGVGDTVYIIQTKAMTKRYPSLLPRDLSPYKRHPRRIPSPACPVPRPDKSELGRLPEGLYVAVRNREDLYIIQSYKPNRVLVAYTRDMAQWFLEEKGAIPFSKKELVLVLDPYYPEETQDLLHQEIPLLLERGFTQFVINNPGQLALFRPYLKKAYSPLSTTKEQKTEKNQVPSRISQREKIADSIQQGPLLIAGPYLYTFNRWAYRFIRDVGFTFTIPPLEISRQNLEKTVPLENRSSILLTLFAYPALFRIRTDLSEVYSFSRFSDSQEEYFQLIAGKEGSLVIPTQPFSIVDKRPFLEQAGFRRFILDFSGPPLRKTDYKDVVAAYEKGEPLINTTRFNWKNGFYFPPTET